MSDNTTSTPKWTEIEHLPEWDEEFYLVFTAKKHGKWVMLKTLRPECKDDPVCREMIQREFDVRYNLAHPNIVMINDFEEVPEVGMSIITDDVYGDSLAKLIKQGKVTEHHIEQLRTRLPMAIRYIQQNHVVHHPITPETVIFTENIGNLKLIDVGFDQRQHLTPADATQDIRDFGHVMLEALKACPSASHAHLEKVARKAVSQHPYRDLASLELALDRRHTDRLYLLIIAFLVAMIAILVWVNSSSAPRLPHALAAGMLS